MGRSFLETSLLKLQLFPSMYYSYTSGKSFVSPRIFLKNFDPYFLHTVQAYFLVAISCKSLPGFLTPRTFHKITESM